LGKHAHPEASMPDKAVRTTKVGSNFDALCWC